MSSRHTPAFALRQAPLSVLLACRRGSKLSDWEGGTRVAGLVAGGYLAQHTRLPAGVVLSGLMHVADFFATICSASGVAVTKDTQKTTLSDNAVLSDLPALDSVSMWNYWIGLQPHSPRTELQISAQTLLKWVDANASNSSVNRLLKLMVGDVPYACWSGSDYPTGGVSDHCSTTVHCGTKGCMCLLCRMIAWGTAQSLCWNSSLS